MRTRTHKKGFTLIELLVVIAIIAILAAILFPVFAKARDRAKQTTCINGLKQFGVAFQTYYQDNDEKFPLASGAPGWGSATGWSEMVYKQIDNFDIYRCPSDPKSNVSYSMNAACSTGPGAAQSVTNVKSPAKMIQLCEAPGAGNHSAHPLTSAAYHHYPPLSTAQNQYGDSDLTTEDDAADILNKNQKDGVVYADVSGNLSATPSTGTPMPIDKYHDLAGAKVGHLYFPGRHNGGNCILFVDSHVAWFRAWDGSKITFDPKNQ